MDGMKSPLQSLTVAAAAGSMLASLLAATGLLDSAAAESAGRSVGEMVSASLALIAIYGRWRATSRIGRED
jgi:hypothetical protein